MKFQIIKFIDLLCVVLQILSQRVQSAKRGRKRFLDSDENNQVSGTMNYELSEHEETWLKHKKINTGGGLSNT